MLRIAVVVLLLLWMAGLYTGRTMGGFVHVLLVLAMIVGLVSFSSWKKSLAILVGGTEDKQNQGPTLGIYGWTF